MRNIPSDCTVVGVPGRIVRRQGKLVNDDSLPDPEAEVIRALFDKIQALEAEVNRLKASRGVVPALNTHRFPHKDNLLIENFLDGAGI